MAWKRLQRRGSLRFGRCQHPACEVERALLWAGCMRTKHVLCSSCLCMADRRQKNKKKKREDEGRSNWPLLGGQGAESCASLVGCMTSDDPTHTWLSRGKSPEQNARASPAGGWPKAHKARPQHKQRATGA